MNKLKNDKHFLYDYQYEAVKNMKNGCILNGGVGSGKSRTALYYYFTKCGGVIDSHEYKAMTKPKSLYIITTARKRDTLEWEGELAPFLLTSNKEISIYYNLTVVVDSWNNIKKYQDVKNAFFIFDEQRVVGYGAWTKAFLKIAKNNEWILLSATPGDCWTDYIPVFIANGFYRNKSEFMREHAIFSRFTKYPKIDRFVNTKRLIRQRDDILINMDFIRTTEDHHIDVLTTYNREKYKEAIKTRWNPYRNLPMQQASDLCYVLRRIVNEDDSRQVALAEILEEHPRVIIFYNFDYELEILRNMSYIIGLNDGSNDFEIAEWNGHNHQEIPNTDKWVYLVQYSAGAEGWNCIKTDTIVFYSQNYSYKLTEQACGRIRRLNTPFKDLYYYHLKSNSSIDLAISRSLKNKKNFNEGKFIKW